LLMMSMVIGNSVATPVQPKLQEAAFAGGCFWCMQHPFDTLHGVSNVSAGYANGNGKDPVYADYAEKGYIETIHLLYDPTIISYETLLDVFWKQIDPTDAGGQFNDRGPQYRSAIFYYTDQQKDRAAASKEALQKSGKFSKPIVTEILKAGPFYDAEEYHQSYYKKNPIRYNWFRFNSGRDRFLNKIWANAVSKKTENSVFKKPSDAELRKLLTPIQYEVTQRGGTEKAFKNEYWNNEKPGIYVDIVSGEPLFSSLDKFESGTGWPSFTKPLEPKNIVQKEDKGWFHTRTEIRSRQGDSHLGHVFPDGPPPTGLRYCMNSAALRFIPVENLEQEGLGEYKKMFSK
jgi:peptide methionine sulfoxide reductase msrA/msrB